MKILDWVVRTAVGIATQSLRITLRIILALLRRITPLAILLLLWVAQLIMTWVLVTVIGTLRNPITSTATMARYWQGRIVERGYLRNHEDFLFSVLRCYAWLVIISGWVFLITITWWIVDTYSPFMLEWKEGGETWIAPLP